MCGICKSTVFPHMFLFWTAPKLYPPEVWVYSHTGSSVRVTWRGVNTQVGEENIEGYLVRIFFYCYFSSGIYMYCALYTLIVYLFRSKKQFIILASHSNVH